MSVKAKMYRITQVTKYTTYSGEQRTGYANLGTAFGNERNGKTSLSLKFMATAIVGPSTEIALFEIDNVERTDGGHSADRDINDDIAF